MENLCRICRTRCLNRSKLIHAEHDGILITEMLLKVCPLDILLDDPIGQLLPQSICNDCIEVLSAAYNLQRVSIESDQYFRSMISNDQIVVKNEIFDDILSIKEEDDEIHFLEDEQETEHVTYLVPVPKKRKISTPLTTFRPRLALYPLNKSDPHFECNFCLLQFKPKQAAVRHMRMDHDPVVLPFGCDYCAARFKNDEKKSLHENIRHGGEIPSVIVCRVCGINGISDEGMNNHMIDDHNMFDVESDEFEAVEGAKESDVTVFHPRAVSKPGRLEDIYACNFCHNKQKSKRTLLHHMYDKHDPKKLPYHCLYCDQRFKDETKKNQHQSMHASSDEPIHVCDICGASGIRELGMEHHTIDDHGPQITVEPISTRQEGRLPRIPVRPFVTRILKKKDINFNPRALPGSESLEYEDIWYVCNFCDKKIKPRMSMLRHMRKHSAIAFPYGCEYCVERFEEQDEFVAHVKYIHDDSHVKKTFFCDMCGVSGDSKEGMENHINDDHFVASKRGGRKRVMSFRCNLCPAKFHEKHRLDNHLLTRHREPTKCDKCEEEFSDKREMSNHMMMVHSKLYRQLESDEIEVCYKCCKCERNHENETQLIEHLKSHRVSFLNEKTKCYFCPKNLKDFKEFFEHARYHAQPQTHECLTCKKRLPFDDRLLNHVKNHKRYDCYKVECKKCLQKFRSAKDLEIHDKVKHNKETLFICPICAKSLSSANGLDQHIRYVHNKEQEKKFQCKFCPMKFILKTKLTRHEAVHSTVRPHVCEICGSSFKHSEGLALHMKRHNGTLERKHECSQCTHKFTTKHRLEQHMMTHTGLKPHECKFCDRAYASKGDLVKHMQKLHVGDAIYQCEKCLKGFRVIVELREHQQEHANQH